MNGYIGNTDFDWYEFLRARRDLKEVNFWQPSGEREFHAIQSGAPFFFRLKKPHYAICGFGFLSFTDILPAWLAWDTFGPANGAATREQMLQRIERYRRVIDPQRKYLIGCLMIWSPVFFEHSQWIREPYDWHPNIVQGKTLDLTKGEGLRIWEQCRLQAHAALVLEEVRTEERFGKPVLIRPRLGQGSFRIAVMEAYGRACAITTEHSLPVLESAHIKCYANGGEHQTSNGILLRSDIHRLFDKGYVTVSEDLRFIVSPRLRQDFANGKSYYGHHGKELRVPENEQERPSRDMLIWHNENCYKD